MFYKVLLGGKLKECYYTCCSLNYLETDLFQLIQLYIFLQYKKKQACRKII